MDGLWSRGHGFSPWFQGPKWDPQRQLKEGPCPLKRKKVQSLLASYAVFWKPISKLDSWRQSGCLGYFCDKPLFRQPKPTLKLLQGGIFIPFVKYEHIWTIRGKQIQTVWKHNAVVIGLCFLFLQDFLYLLEKKKRGWNKEKVTFLNSKGGYSFKWYHAVNSAETAQRSGVLHDASWFGCPYFTASLCMEMCGPGPFP